VADEILYHARIHPEQRTNTLTEEQIAEMHAQTIYVCSTAVGVNADSSKFPTSWLFRHRWGKGKKIKADFKLPSGDPATIKWLTVGGRTSAFVVELQSLPRAKGKDGGEIKKSDVQTESKYFPSTSKRKRSLEAGDEDLLEDTTALVPEVKTVVIKRTSVRGNNLGVAENTDLKEMEKGGDNKPLTRASKRRKAEEDERSASQPKGQPPPKRTRKWTTLTP